MSPRIALATCAVLPDGHPDDAPVAAALGATWAAWDDPSVDWDAFDLVVLRSVWNYTTRRADFLAWCDGIGDRLRNRPDLVAFNSDKAYLLELGVPVVPTRLVRPGDDVGDLDGEVVVKPTVSAGAADTGRFGPAAHDAARALVDAITAGGRTAMVQPYLPAVDTAGERALVHLRGELSHVLHKRAVLAPDEIAPPAEGVPVPAAAIMFEDDLVTPGTATDAQVALGRQVLETLTTRFGASPLYARVDVVDGPDGTPVVMEVEAIEPLLYLGLVPGAAERVVAAIRAEL